MQLNKTPNFRPASPAINNWQFRSSANLTDSPYVRPSAPAGKSLGIGNKIKLGTATFLIATAPVLAQTGSAPGTANWLDTTINFAINHLTMPISTIFSYVNGGSAQQKGLFVTAIGVGAYVAGRRIAKKQLDRVKDKWGRGFWADLKRGTIKHVAGVVAAAAMYYALAPALIKTAEYIINAWSKF